MWYELLGGIGISQLSTGLRPLNSPSTRGIASSAVAFGCWMVLNQGAVVNMHTAFSDPTSQINSGLLPLPGSQATGTSGSDVVDSADGKSGDGGPASVTDIIGNLNSALGKAVRDILKVNSATKVLALNARIEASRAGEHGAAFGIVAQEMQRLSERTSEIAAFMADETQKNTQQLMAMIGWHIRGQRLSDQALMNIDLIDRCLYERTCDVRWWATDNAVVDAADKPTPERLAYATKRLAVILKAYTVYFDLVLSNQHGTLLCNGRPELYQAIGQDVARHDWFQSAMSTTTGDEYGFEFAPGCGLVNSHNALIYSAAVRDGGDSRGRILGTLGIVFNWDSLAQPILQKTARTEAGARCYIVDAQANILASDTMSTGVKLCIPDFARVLAQGKGYFVDTIDDQLCCVAHAASPGFETYKTGWYSVIIQPV